MSSKFQHSLPSRGKATLVAILLLYGCATLQFVRFYSKSTTFYLNLPLYLNGRERIPFQERVLPILFLRPFYASSWVMHRLAHNNGAFTEDRGPFYLLSLVSLVIAGVYTQRLYNLLTRTGSLKFLVYPVFLFAVMWTYVIHSEADFSYPYDFLSLAFFTAGLYYIYSRRFLALSLVLLAGTFNRETTLFLIGIYVLDSASSNAGGLRRRFCLSTIPWGRVALLALIWLAIKLPLAHIFRFNDSKEDFLRINYNLNVMKPRLFPALLNVCGYLIPLVLLFWHSLRPRRFANYLFILVPWLAVMFCSGVLIETRIYGELCSYAAISLVLIMERPLAVPLRPATRSLPATTHLVLEPIAWSAGATEPIHGAD